ncbi:hypothetical protein Tco_0527795 [Tanacetum coccineum]
MRMDPIKTPKEPTYQVVLDALALTTCYPAFLITSEVPEIYMQHFWHTITKIKNSSSYKFKLDKNKCTVDVEKLSNLSKNLVINRCLFRKTTVLDKIKLSRAQILWGMYYNQNVDFVKLLWEDFMFQIDNRDSKKQKKMYYPRFSKTIIQHFISNDKSISIRNNLFMHIVQDDSVLGSLRFVSKPEEYQLAFATEAATPKKERKFKKPASFSKKKTLVAVEEPAKKPAAKTQSACVKIRDTPGVSVSKKKAPTNTERSKGIEFLSKAGPGSEPEVPDEQKGKSTNTSEGTGLILGVADVSKADSSKSRYESWGDSDDDDDDDQQGNDERTKSNNNKDADLNKTDDEEDKFVYTPGDYVPIDDENIDDEYYDRINKEMYSDVNVELKDIKL